MRTLEQTAAAVGAPVFLTELRDFDGHAAAFGRWRFGDTPSFKVSEADALRVVMSVRSASDIHHAEGGRTTHISPFPGYVVVFPPGRSSEYTVKGEVDILAAHIDAGNFGQPACEWPKLPSLAVADEAMRAAVVTSFVRTRGGDGPRSRKAATLLRRMACDLLLSRAQRRDHPHRGGLRPTARRRIERLIEERLDGPQRSSPSVAELAAEVGFSVNHFIRAFREATGTTPYQHVMARRQQRALALLDRPDLSIADVADLLGFSSPAYFGTVFRQRLGVTPGEYKAAMLDHGS